jgi:hypothetical protein
MKRRVGTGCRARLQHSRSRWAVWSRTLAGAAALAVVGLRPAFATEGGGSVYPYGLNTVASGVLPKPGHYLYSYNSYYTADVTTTNDGQPAPVPFDVDVRVHTLRYLQVLESAKLFGGSVGWLVAQPYLIGDAHIGPRKDSRSGFGDTTVGLMIGWHGPHAHSMTGVDVTLPTGSYSTEHLFNPGRNQYAGTFYYALTAPLGERLDANLRTNLTVNGTNRDTDYHSGMEAGVEYSLNLRFAKGWFAGINGYLYQQITDDTIDGDAVGGDGHRLRVLAYGPQLIYRGGRWGAVAKWQHEALTRNKAEGDKYWLQLFFAL